jgi:hypothetical protein
MDTKIQYVVKENGERVYFKDSEATEIIENTKQKKLIAGRGLKLNGNVLSLADNIGGGSDLKYFTVNDMLSHSSYEGAETYGDTNYSKMTVEFAYLGNPQLFTEYVNTHEESDYDDNRYMNFGFVSEIDSNTGSPNKQKVLDVVSTLETTDDDYFCVFPLRVISGEFHRDVTGYSSSSDMEACLFAKYSYDEYGAKQPNEDNKVEATTVASNITPIIWKHFAD